jgi:hypothetical protein
VLGFGKKKQNTEASEDKSSEDVGEATTEQAPAPAVEDEKRPDRDLINAKADKDIDQAEAAAAAAEEGNTEETSRSVTGPFDVREVRS